MYGILKLRNKILGDPDLGWRDQYEAHGTEEDERPQKAGAINVERAGTAPSDGRLESEHGGGADPTVEAAAAEGEEAAMAAAAKDAERPISDDAGVPGPERDLP